MGLDQFRSQAIFLDTAPIIYLIEGHEPFQATLFNFFAAHNRGEFTLVSSVLTYLEVLVRPIRMDRWDLVDQYKQIMNNTTGFQVIEVDSTIAYKAAELRAKYKLKTPDAIQISTAIEAQAHYFLTNDFRLKQIEEITIITPAEL
ncbi:PIN domain-containing protein [soil metagenome]